MAAPHPDDADLKRLVLTTARVLRAHIKESLGTYSDEDVAALNEALAPYDPVKAELVNEADG